jgi:hypothetical protein
MEKDMKRNLMWIAASLAAFGAAASAQTYSNDPGYGYGNAYGQAIVVRCESIDSRPEFCRADHARDVRIVRQLSRENCVQGRNWDYNDDGIRVTDGCRAEFQVTRNERYNDNGNGYGQDDRYGNGRPVYCQSRGYARTYCGDAYGNYQMTGRYDRDCVQGRTFGQDSRGLWVSGNCSATFQRTGNDDRYGNGRGNGRGDGYGRESGVRDDGRYDSAGTVHCLSNSSGRTYCGDARTRWTLRDQRNPGCIPGRTWGNDERGLWVSNPCRGDFERVSSWQEPRNDTFPNDYRDRQRD